MMSVQGGIGTKRVTFIVNCEPMPPTDHMSLYDPADKIRALVGMDKIF